LSRVTSEMLKDNAQNWLFSRMRAFDEVHPDWMLYLCQIAAGIMSLDINDFINWTVIKLTIFTDDQGLLTSKQVDFLKSSLEWEPRIRPALVESPVGNPPFSRIYPPSSAGRIRQAYILKRYELEFGCNIEECDLIVEFGGGYGAMALLACKYGFSGKYIIIDNEPMSSLQAWYLSENAGPVHYGTDIGEEPGIYFAGLSDYDTIETAVKNAERPIFLANWSLSETPADLRMRTMEWLARCGFQALGITYQGHFGMDNTAFFTSEASRFLERYELAVKPFVYGIEEDDYFSRHRMMSLTRL